MPIVMSNPVQLIETRNSTDFQALKGKRISSNFPTLWAIGNLEILNDNLLGIFCSIKCPGRIILKTYDLMRVLRDSGVSVAGGFHSPIEKDCLDILIKGAQPIVVCPARSIIRMRIPKTWKKAIDTGRMLILSPFGEKQKRPTISSAHIRNQLVIEICSKFVIPYADSGSKTERLYREIIDINKPVYTFESSIRSARSHLNT